MPIRIVALFLVLEFLGVYWGFAVDAQSEAQPGKPQPALVAALKQNGARIAYHRHTKKTSFIGFAPGAALQVLGSGPTMTAEESAMVVFGYYGNLFGVREAATELSLTKKITAPGGRSTLRYRQNYQGVPVVGGELIVNMDAQNRLISLNGESSPGLTLSVKPTVTAPAARQTALETIAKVYGIGVSLLTASTPVLEVYDPRLIGPESLPPSLVWRTRVWSTDMAPIDEFVLVHARRGHIVLHFNQIHTAKNRRTYDAAGTASLPGGEVCNESSGDACTGGVNADADAAHQHAGDTYDFYSANHGRDSIDGSGITLASTVNSTVSACPNAFWYPALNQMVYCTDMPQADDVVAHELTHGVTNSTSKLFYYYQSGAINESLSDVWGEFVDITNGSDDDDATTRWQAGEGSAVGVIRNLQDPTLYGQPDRMTHANYYALSGDSGGVHTNSGVNNKAAYLMVDGSALETGGMFNGKTITAMGIPKVAKIYYEVQTRLLTSGADYLDLYNALYQACLNLVGTAGITNADCTNVRNTTDAVEMNLPPVVATTPTAALCPVAGERPSNFFFDNFEGGAGKWGFSSSPSTPGVWAIDATWAGPYATSGAHSLYFEDGYSNVAATATMAISVLTPASGVYVHLNHAFGFYSGASNDGGLVEYSLDGGLTWADISTSWQAGQNYNGTLGALNPIPGTPAAFTGTSNGYVSSRYFVPANNQNLRLRFRAGTGNTYNYGWWIDDVRIYTCVPNSAPSAPVLTSPANNAVNINSSSVNFQWQTSSDADGDTLNYALEVCTDAGFTTCVTTITKGNAVAPFTVATLGGGLGLWLVTMIALARHRRLATVASALILGALLASGCGSSGSGGGPVSLSYTDTSLAPGTTYYWRVTADDGNSGTAASAAWRFTTAP